MNRRVDEPQGIYKSDEEYMIKWSNLRARDAAKVKLFEELNEKGYYLIVVDYSIKVKDRPSYIWKSFWEQFSKQTRLTDWQ